MQKEKKKYLKQYLLQETKINRIKRMLLLNPEKAELYKELIESSVKLRDKIEEEIKSVDSDILSELLYQKYIFGKTLEEIALTLNYSKRHIERLHIKALENFKIK